jgi:carboxypeptidase C (cathepsin A)
LTGGGALVEEEEPMQAFRTLAFLGLVALAHAAAADEPKEPKEPKKEAAPAKPVPDPRSFVTAHTGRFGGEAVAYTATAGETYLLDRKGEPTASIFSFAYVKDGLKDPATRPVTFLWNGGPGSSSIWLHMGSMGPRRVAVPSDARPAGSPPYTVEDNAGALLDVTDLVFVDPVGTGFSHALGAHEDKEFWGLNPDADSVADFIRAWLTKNRRWASPKYLAGESFGTTRAAAVAGRLEGDDRGISLNGLVLISEALDYEGSTPEPDNLISFVTYLPTEAATAWYHGKVEDAPRDLAAFLDEARAFAVDEYAPALFKGNRLDAETRARIRKRLAHYTGLSEDYVERADLRILATRFRKELLRAEGKAVGRLDGRYVGDDLDDTAAEPDGDAASYGIDGAYVASFNDYLDRELAVRMDRPYEVSVDAIDKDWNWRPVPEGESWEPSYVDVSRDLSRAMRRNPSLRVMVAAGYYDFATPFFDAEYTFGRHGILADRVVIHRYEAGHMMYLNQPSLDALQADMRSFLRASAR